MLNSRQDAEDLRAVLAYAFEWADAQGYGSGDVAERAGLCYGTVLRLRRSLKSVAESQKLLPQFRSVNRVMRACGVTGGLARSVVAFRTQQKETKRKREETRARKAS